MKSLLSISSLRYSAIALISGVFLPLSLEANELLFDLDFRDGLKSNEPLVLTVEERGEGSGGPTDAPRGEGNAWMFDGSSALVVELPDQGLLRFSGNDPFTLEAWLRLERDNVAGPIISKGSGGNYRLSISPKRRPGFSYYAAGSWRSVESAGDPLPLREWSHLLAQYHGADQTVTLVIDGKVAAVKQMEAPIKGGDGSPLFIGGFQGNDGRTRGLAGAVGGIRIYSGIKYPQAADVEVGTVLFDPTAGQ